VPIGNITLSRMSLRPSYVLHMRRRRVLRPTTSPRLTIARQRAADIDRPPRQQRSPLDSPARTRDQWSVTRPRQARILLLTSQDDGAIIACRNATTPAGWRCSLSEQITSQPALDRVLVHWC